MSKKCVRLHFCVPPRRPEITRTPMKTNAKSHFRDSWKSGNRFLACARFQFRAESLKRFIFEPQKVCLFTLLRAVPATGNHTNPYENKCQIAFPRFLGKWKSNPRVCAFSVFGNIAKLETRAREESISTFQKSRKCNLAFVFIGVGVISGRRGGTHKCKK